MYIVVEISKKNQPDEIVEKSEDFGFGIPEPTDAVILSNVSDRLGKPTEDYKVLRVDRTSNDFKKIQHEKVKYKPKWDGDDVIGIDTDEYDGWDVLKITSDKTILNPNETAVLTYTAYESDGITIDTGYQKNIDIDYGKGKNTILTEKIKFHDGVGTFDFTPTEYGMYSFPLNTWHDKKNDLRVENPIFIDVRVVF